MIYINYLIRKNMRKIIKIVLLTIISITTLISCGNKDKTREIVMPGVSGKAGDLLIVIDKAYWDELGDSFRFILAAEYPFLPQREPLFNIYNTPHKAFSGSFVSHRNILIVNIGEKFDTSKVVIQEDVWAAPQTVITISSPDRKELLKTLQSQKEKIVSSLEQAERNRVITNAKKYQEYNLRTLVQKRYKYSPYFPKGFSLKKETKDFLWISYETTYVTQGIFIYDYPYNDANNLTAEGIIKQRNEILKQNVPGMFEGSYMTTSSLIDPVTRWVTYKKEKFAETRGLWEVQNDYMGGPFISHSIIDEENKRIIVMEGFVYAPKFTKRNYLRYVESILYSCDKSSK